MLLAKNPILRKAKGHLSNHPQLSYLFLRPFNDSCWHTVIRLLKTSNDLFRMERVNQFYGRFDTVLAQLKCKNLVEEYANWQFVSGLYMGVSSRIWTQPEYYRVVYAFMILSVPIDRSIHLNNDRQRMNNASDTLSIRIFKAVGCRNTGKKFIQRTIYQNITLKNLNMAYNNFFSIWNLNFKYILGFF